MKNEYRTKKAHKVTRTKKGKGSSLRGVFLNKNGKYIAKLVHKGSHLTDNIQYSKEEDAGKAYDKLLESVDVNSISTKYNFKITPKIMNLNQKQSDIKKIKNFYGKDVHNRNSLIKADINKILKRKSTRCNYDLSDKIKHYFSKVDERVKMYKQDYCCAFCSEKLRPDHEFDHIIPRECGGESSYQNMQVLCTGCHMFKSSYLDRTIIRPLLESNPSTLPYEVRKICMEKYKERYVEFM
jgi:hypothetical protein